MEVEDASPEAMAGEVVDTDAEVRSKIGSLLMQSDNERIVTLVGKLIRMISNKVKTLSSTGENEDTPQLDAEQADPSVKDAAQELQVLK